MIVVAVSTSSRQLHHPCGSFHMVVTASSSWWQLHHRQLHHRQLHHHGGSFVVLMTASSSWWELRRPCDSFIILVAASSFLRQLHHRQLHRPCGSFIIFATASSSPASPTSSHSFCRVAVACQASWPGSFRPGKFLRYFRQN